MTAPLPHFLDVQEVMYAADQLERARDLIQEALELARDDFEQHPSVAAELAMRQLNSAWLIVEAARIYLGRRTS